MEVSRLILSKETKEKLGKNLGSHAKGKLLYGKLTELDNSGLLSKATNRFDVARLVGYPAEKLNAGYSWLANLIRRGHVKETLIEIGKNGDPIYEYHVTGTAKYDYSGGRVKGSKVVNGHVVMPEEKKEEPVQVILNEPVAETKVIATMMNVKIEVNGLAIEMTNPSADFVAELVKQLTKGE